MGLLGKYFRSAKVARVAPFFIFLVLTTIQGKPETLLAYWMYLAKTLVGLWLIWEMRPFVAEMRWAFSREAVVVGLGVFAVWVGIDGGWATQSSLWVKLGFVEPPKTPAPAWNPHHQFGQGSALAWLFVTVRMLGSTFVVPPLEEVFYRSFLYRFSARHDFQEISLGKFLPLPFLATATVFGLMHNEWLAGILCGAAYQWLVIRKGRLGDAMTAHAITNFLLGAWVVWKGAWNFW